MIDYLTISSSNHLTGDVRDDLPEEHNIETPKKNSEPSFSCDQKMNQRKRRHWT